MKASILNYLLKFKFTHKRKSLMRTPCVHLFHNVCLEKWLDMKSECPYCRRELPPLE